MFLKNEGNKVGLEESAGRLDFLSNGRRGLGGLIIVGMGYWLRLGHQSGPNVKADSLRRDHQKAA